VVEVVQQLRGAATSTSETAPGGHSSPPSVKDLVASRASQRQNLRRRPWSAASLRGLLGGGGEFQTSRGRPPVSDVRNKCSERQLDVAGALTIVALRSTRDYDSI